MITRTIGTMSAILIFSLILLFTGFRSEAQSIKTALLPNFGGKLLVNFTCTCSGNSLLTIQDVRGQTKEIIYQPGASRLYAYYTLVPSVNVLGDYVPGVGKCTVYAAVGCSPHGAPLGTIRQIGTSLPSIKK